jgi:hypothetical protein
MPIASTGSATVTASTLAPGARQHADDVGEVELALVVIGLDLIQRGPQPRGVEAVHAGVDLADLLLVRRCVAVLDDAA